MSDLIELNGRSYRKPQHPTVVICVDGCDPEYLDRGIPDGVFPTIGSFRRDGYLGTADAAIPTFTNPNNVSIVTGAPPSVHGIAGNYCLDRETGREIMMTDPDLMRSETILSLMAGAGVRTAAITAKDKLRKLLGRNLVGICFSSECASPEVEEMVGRAKPDMYSADLSLFVLDAGIALLERREADLLYLSLSDYVQHAHPPGDPEADAFHRAIDDRVRRLVELGAVVGLVADHGMNDKALPDGAPNVIFLEDELNKRFRRRCRASDLPDNRPVCAPSRGARLVRAGLCSGRCGNPRNDGGERVATRCRPRSRRARSSEAFRNAGRPGGRFRCTR